MKKTIMIFLLMSLSIFYILSYPSFFQNINISTQCNISEINKDIININNSYIKNCITPKFLYIISEEDMSKEEQTMISTLQGIVATKSEKQIYILSSNEPDYKIWLKDLKSKYHIKVKSIEDPWKLIKIFNSYVDSYILSNNSNPPSINNACSLASLKNSIVIDESIEAKIISLGITKLAGDCRYTDKYWAYNTLWNSGLNHSTVIQLSPDISMALRDYAIISKSLVFYEDDKDNANLRKDIFSSMNDNGHCLGWGPDEHTNVSIASSFGIDVVASDWSYNLSVLSSYPSIPQKQNINTNIPKENNAHYVTFIVSDGDNQQWYLGNNFSSENWYGSPYRGNFNLGWSISPSLYYLAPTVFDKYYKAASSINYNDYFLVPPSGNGYIYPSKFPFNKLDIYTESLSDYMRNVDQNYVIVIDDNSFYQTSLWNKYTCHSNIDGLFYLNYSKHNDYNGNIIWSNDKPIVSCRDLLWNGLEDESELITNINNRVNLGYTNVENPESYTFVYLHAWSKNMSDLQRTISKLNENPKVRVVTPNIFMKLIKSNVHQFN